MQRGPFLGAGRDVLGGHSQRPQQRIQRLAGLDRGLVVPVQVDEQHPAAEPALLDGGVPGGDGQRGLAHPRQPGHRRDQHRPRHLCRVQ